jgi:uncharacterized protein (TIGR03067 family)
MNTRVFAALGIALLVALTAGADEANKTDKDKLQGAWITVSAEMNGDKLPEEIVKALEFVVKGDSFEVKGPEVVLEQYAKGKFKVDATTMPRSIDITVGAGAMKGDVVEGIYEFDDDMLKICATLVGKNRPSDYSTKAGSNMVSLVLKRAKQ